MRSVLVRAAGVVLVIGLLLVSGPSADAPAQGLPGTHWVFAEGTTLPGWTEYLTFLNPGTGPAAVTIRYSLEDSDGMHVGERVVGLDLEAGERRTIDVSGDGSLGAGPGYTGVAATIDATRPIVAERPVYFASNIPGLGLVQGAHVALGILAPRPHWYFAEGTTLPGFRPYLAIHNPGDRTARARVTYSFEAGRRPTEVTVTVPAHGRRTVDVAGEGEGALGEIEPGVSIEVDGGADALVVERPIYFSRPFGARGVIGGATIGAPAGDPATTWTFSEGTTLDSFVEYVTLFNPGAASLTVTMEYRLESGAPQIRRCEIDPRSRLTVLVFDPTAPCGLGRDLNNGTLGEGVSVTVYVTGGGVVAERPIYFTGEPGARTGGAHLALGHAGAPVAERWFAEGTTRAGFETFWTIDNPQVAAMQVDIAYFTGGGATTRRVVVPGRQRVTVRASDAAGGGIGPDVDFGARVASVDGRGFGVERAVYATGAAPFSDGHVGSGVFFGAAP